MLLLACFGTLTACGFGVNYTITYIVNGEVWAEESVQGGEKITFPADPVVAGYTFGGWYLDAECTEPLKSNHVESEPARTFIVAYGKLTLTGAGAFDIESYVVEIPSDAEDITAEAAQTALRTLVARLTSSSYEESSYFKLTAEGLEAIADADSGIVTNIVANSVTEYYVPTSQYGGYEIATTELIKANLSESTQRIPETVLTNGISRVSTTTSTTQLGTELASEDSVVWYGLIDDLLYALRDTTSVTSDDGTAGTPINSKYWDLVVDTQMLYAYSMFMFEDIVSFMDVTHENSHLTTAQLMFTEPAGMVYGMFSSTGTLKCKLKDGIYYITIEHATQNTGEVWTETLKFSESSLFEYSNMEYFSADRYTVAHRLYESGAEQLVMPSRSGYSER